MAEVKRSILHQHPIPELPGYENRIIRLEFPPGAEGSVHSHPVIGLGYVALGEHYSQWEAGEREYYKAGDTFVDRANERHILTSNPSKTETLVIVLSYVIKVGEANRVDL